MSQTNQLFIVGQTVKDVSNFVGTIEEILSDKSAVVCFGKNENGFNVYRTLFLDNLTIVTPSPYSTDFDVVRNQIFFLRNFILVWEEQKDPDFLSPLFNNVILSWKLPMMSADELLYELKTNSETARIVFEYIELQGTRRILYKAKDIKEWSKKYDMEFDGKFPDAIWTYSDSYYFYEIDDKFYMDFNNQCFETSDSDEMEKIMATQLIHH